MGGSAAGACGYDYGEEALRTVDTPGHKKYGRGCFRDAGVSSNLKNKTEDLRPHQHHQESAFLPPYEPKNLKLYRVSNLVPSRSELKTFSLAATRAYKPIVAQLKKTSFPLSFLSSI